MTDITDQDFANHCDDQGYRETEETDADDRYQLEIEEQNAECLKGMAEHLGEELKNWTGTKSNEEEV